MYNRLYFIFCWLLCYIIIYNLFDIRYVEIINLYIDDSKFYGILLNNQKCHIDISKKIITHYISQNEKYNIKIYTIIEKPDRCILLNTFTSIIFEKIILNIGFLLFGFICNLLIFYVIYEIIDIYIKNISNNDKSEQYTKNAELEKKKINVNELDLIL